MIERAERRGGLYLLRLMEADLPNRHAAVFLQVRPWRVDHSDVIPLVACSSVNCDSLPYAGVYIRSPAQTHVWHVVVGDRREGSRWLDHLTFNRVCLGQLRAILYKRRRYVLPRLPGG